MTPERESDSAATRRGLLALIVAGLSVAAFFAAPYRPAAGLYAANPGRLILPGCDEIHCFRILLPWTVGMLPLPTVFKWRAFAVLCNAGAATAVFDFCLMLGLQRRTATLAALLSAFGFGALYSIFETFSSDPLIFWLGPMVVRWLIEGRRASAALVMCISVFAKEFVVMAAAMVGVWAASQRRWQTARGAFGTAAVAFLVWSTLQLLLMGLFGYSYGGAATKPASQLLSGSWLMFWLANMPPSAALAAVFNEFGAIYLLAPIGWFSAPRLLKQLVIAALPFALFLAYVEQPDRALWNFHFLACPLAAIVLADAPLALSGAFIGFFAMANLRVGAQVLVAPPARFPLAASIALAIAAIALHARSKQARIDAIEFHHGTDSSEL